MLNGLMEEKEFQNTFHLDKKVSTNTGEILVEVLILFFLLFCLG